MSRALRLGLAGIAVASLAGAAPASAVNFRSPTRNIACDVNAARGVRCEIRHFDWNPPRKPDWCDYDWGGGMVIAGRGWGEFLCARDTIWGTYPVLRYGHSIRRGRFRCTSRRTGVTCVNRRNRDGFKLARERAVRF
jgi:hypothetical protein